jgi:hypothetical protein
MAREHDELAARLEAEQAAGAESPLRVDQDSGRAEPSS